MSLLTGYKPLQHAAYRDLEKGPQDVIIKQKIKKIKLFSSCEGNILLMNLLMVVNIKRLQ